MQTVRPCAKGLDATYSHIYSALKDYGYSAAYALRILIEAKRGETTAWWAIRMARRARRLP